MGWSMSTIKNLNLTPRDLGLDQDEFTPGCLKAVTKEVCVKLYRDQFWDKWGYGKIADQKVATKVFDCAVNCGPGHAAQMAQRAANANGQSVIIDGNLGTKSFAGINAVDPQTFVHAYADQMRAYYNGLVSAKPKLGKFLKNWLHRASWGE